MRDGARELDDRLAGALALALPPQEVARRRQRKVKVELRAPVRRSLLNFDLSPALDHRPQRGRRGGGHA